VLDAAGAELPVEVGTPPGKRGVSLRPMAPWLRGRRYRVAVDSRLEDLAGNSLSRVFDRDLDRPEDGPAGREDRVVDFVSEW
jgi:hypothetical protein